MLNLLLAVLATSSPSEIPADLWRCDNQIEVWCTVDGCAAKKTEETTPMDIWARTDGVFSVCAYTGCWEGKAKVSDTAGRLVWAADAVPFSTRPDGEFTADVSLLIVKKDGAGFVRIGGIASPLLCVRAKLGE
jgi:hypothetical protein